MAKRRISTISFIAGIILVISGGLIWFFTDQSSKIFELSNDIIGAGLLATVVGVIAKLGKR
jgi:hypothetical protein